LIEFFSGEGHASKLEELLGLTFYLGMKFYFLKNI